MRARSGGNRPAAAPSEKKSVLFATPLFTLLSMDRSSKAVAAAIEEIAKRGERSCLFWWLVEYHDQIRERMARQRISWVAFAEQMTRMGLTDRTGKAATPNTVKTTWHRAKIYVASERTRSPSSATLAASPRSMPSAENARPIPAPSSVWGPQPEIAVQPAAIASSLALVPAGSLETWPEPTVQSAPPGPYFAPAVDPQMPAATAARIRTPEAQARIDAVLARARAKLDDEDKHLRL